MRGVFITGTNTGVGKTWITASLLRRLRAEGRRVGAYKPVCSGAETGDDGGIVWPDIEALHTALDGEFPRESICPQTFAAALAPPSAARLEGREVDPQLLRDGIGVWNDAANVILVEGVGGWLCPIAEGETIADLANDFGFPILLVAALELGAINHTLLTVESIRQRGLPLAGIVLNETTPELDATLSAETSAAIETYVGCEIVGRCRYDDEVEWGGDFVANIGEVGM